MGHGFEFPWGTLQVTFNKQVNKYENDPEDTNMLSYMSQYHQATGFTRFCIQSAFQKEHSI